MITSLNVASIYVLDKDEALDFYVNKLGLEKGNYVRQGDYRWLTVRVPGQAGTEVSLEQPGSPLHDEATTAQLRELISKGALGGLVFITDDARGLYEMLKERGVTDFTQEPTDHFYGTDMGLRDPFGNPIRILQQGKAAQQATAKQLRELITKGALSGLVFHTDDARAFYETLQERGVTDFTQEPIDHFYGTDMGLRDPFGNAIRILERKTSAAATA